MPDIVYFAPAIDPETNEVALVKVETPRQTQSATLIVNADPTLSRFYEAREDEYAQQEQ